MERQTIQALFILMFLSDVASVTACYGKIDSLSPDVIYVIVIQSSYCSHEADDRFGGRGIDCVRKPR